MHKVVFAELTTCPSRTFPRVLLAAAAIGGLSCPASAVVTNFTYTATLNATVDPVYTEVDGKIPHIDQDAKAGKLDGTFQLELAGSFDTDDVTTVGGLANLKVVAANLDSVTTNTLGTIFTNIYGESFNTAPSINITTTPAGALLFSFTASALYDTDLSGSREWVQLFSPTTIQSSVRNAPGTLGTFSLLSTGQYLTSQTTITDLYGIQKSASDGFEPYRTTAEYLDHGADVVNGFTPAGYPSNGVFTLFRVAAPDPIGPTAPPPGVPEPTSWITFIVGFGLAGAAMRSRRKAVVTFDLT